MCFVLYRAGFFRSAAIGFYRQSRCLVLMIFLSAANIAINNKAAGKDPSGLPVKLGVAGLHTTLRSY